MTPANVATFSHYGWLSFADRQRHLAITDTFAIIF